MSKILAELSYSELLNAIKAEIASGENAIRQTQAKTYWNIGKLISEHLLKHNRAEYGAHLFPRLSKNLDVDLTTLHQAVKFYEKYPILSARTQLPWSHYRSLLALPDEAIRKALIKKAVAEKLTSRQLQKEVSSHKPRAARHDLLTPLRGKLNTYAIIERPTIGGKTEKLVDLGFGVFQEIPVKLRSKLKPGDFAGKNFRKIKAAVKDLYTYPAVVEKVLDGDTIKVRIDLGYKTSCRDTLRLRNLDCREMDTKEGQGAKTYVQSLVKESCLLIIRSSRSDKYDRYLADIFLPQGAKPNPATDIYLNNLLLEKGFAQKWTA